MNYLRRCTRAGQAMDEDPAYTPVEGEPEEPEPEPEPTKQASGWSEPGKCLLWVPGHAELWLMAAPPSGVHPCTRSCSSAIV